MDQIFFLLAEQAATSASDQMTEVKLHYFRWHGSTTAVAVKNQV